MKKLKNTKKQGRRDFIKASSAGAAGFMIIPRHVLGGKGFVPPSDTFNIVGIGAGGKGFSDLTECAKSPHAKVIAFCDVDDRQAVGAKTSWPAAQYFHDFRKMLDDVGDDADGVTISTPDHMHAVAAYSAMQRGKHVYVQKPLTHDIYEARVLTDAADKYKVVTQMGNQGASGEGVRMMKEMYDSGMIGMVEKVICWTNRPIWPQALAVPEAKTPVPSELNWDLWLGTAPYRDYHKGYHPFDWRGWDDYGTGALGDMACHIMDPVFRILPIKYPSSVECSVTGSYIGNFQEKDYSESFPDSSKIHFTYPRTDGPGEIKVAWMDGGIQPERPEGLGPDEPMGNWDGGCIFYGTKGTLMADCYGANPRLIPTRRMEYEEMPMATETRVPEGHYVQWVNAAIAGYGNGVTSSPFSYAGPFTESILMGNLAIKAYNLKNPEIENDNFWRGNDRFIGRKQLLWDGATMEITNLPDANQWVQREYRGDWNFGSIG